MSDTVPEVIDMLEKTVDVLKKKLYPGKVYRRADLVPFSSNVDRHLKTLVEEGVLTKLQNGLYLCPRQSTFGEVPPEDNKLLERFLKSSKFLVYSPNSFNALGLGTTQLYNLPVVLNQKRHGKLSLGERTFFFQRRLNVPREMTKEVLLVELLNNLKMVSEEHQQLLEVLNRKLSDFDKTSLAKAAKRYGTYSTQKRLQNLLGNNLKYAS